MVLMSQKIGTLCIDYRPPDTVANLVYDEGLFDTDNCSQFVLVTKFFPGYVPLLPIYALDARCYSTLRIKCYSIFDALDFIQHLGLEQFEFKFVPANFSSPDVAREELDLQYVEFAGSLSGDWTMKLRVSQLTEPLMVSSLENQDLIMTGMKQIYPIESSAL